MKPFIFVRTKLGNGVTPLGDGLCWLRAEFIRKGGKSFSRDVETAEDVADIWEDFERVRANYPKDVFDDLPKDLSVTRAR